VRIGLHDGRTFVSQPARARGNPENPLSDDEIAGKFHALADPVLGAARASRIETLIAALPSDDAAFAPLREELAQPVH